MDLIYFNGTAHVLPRFWEYVLVINGKNIHKVDKTLYRYSEKNTKLYNKMTKKEKAMINFKFKY